MRSYLITAPAEEPLSINEVKLNQRITETAENAVVLRLISVARERAEDITGRRLVTQTREVYLEEFPSGYLELPDPPLVSVTHIKYFDADGVEQTLDPLIYQVNIRTDPGRIALGKNKTWPTYQSDVFNPITVRYVCGFGAHAVPAQIKQAMFLMIGHWFENREAVITGTIVSEVPMGAMSLLHTNRLVGV